MKRSALFFLILLTAATTQADIIVGHGYPPGSAMLNPSSLEHYESWAQSFTTPALTYELTSASAFLSSGPSDYLVIASLWDSRPDPEYSFLTLPNHEIARLGSAAVSGYATPTFNAPAGVLLQPEQTYWLLLTSDPGTPLYLGEIDYAGYDNNAAQIGTGTFGRRLKGDVGQSLWANYPGVYNIRVEGTVAAVPEPSTFALAAAALILLAFRRLRLRVY
jgi:hypothetical protein